MTTGRKMAPKATPKKGAVPVRAADDNGSLTPLAGARAQA